MLLVKVNVSLKASESSLSFRGGYVLKRSGFSCHLSSKQAKLQVKGKGIQIASRENSQGFFKFKGRIFRLQVLLNYLHL